MKTITTYIADDGKEFKERHLCEAYEAKIRANKFKDVALLFDSNGTPLPLTDQSFGRIKFIVAKTDEAAQYMFDEFGPSWLMPWEYSTKPTAGVWFYNDDCDRYETPDEICDLVKTLLKIKEKCGV